MGCASSRFDKRNNNCQDLNTVGLQFVGGESHTFDKFPQDRVAWGHDSKKSLEDKFKVSGELAGTDEASITEIYKATWTAVNDRLKNMGAVNLASLDTFNPMTFGNKLVDGRYEKADAVKQLQAVKDFFNENSGIEMEPKKEEPAMMMGDGMMMEDKPAEMMADEMMEGGDEMMMEGDMMMGMGMDGMMMAGMANPHKYDGDAKDYKGWANIPAAILKMMIVNPYFGELVKAEAINWEFNPTKGPKKPEFTAAAGLVGTGVAAGGADGQAIWLSGHLGDEDFQSLSAMGKSEKDEEKAIHFPFLTFGWATKDEALQALALDEAKGKQKYHKVVFEVTGAKAMKFLDCRQVAHRLNGKISGAEEGKEGVNTYKVEAAALEAQSIEDWEKAVKAAAEAAAAAAAAAKETPAADMMMEKPADMMMEGEMMMEDKPAEMMME
jgi:hypothetical protein